MKKLLIILDAAHGEETPGKRSPDGQHREYKWSRDRIKAIAPILQSLGYKIEYTNVLNLEIGLTQRKNTATEIAKRHPDLVTLLVSIHNDAVNATPEWQNKASGISVWTSKGKTTSDIFAYQFLKELDSALPEVKKRTYNVNPLDQNFEANFTVLMGAYSAVLLECMFQDNKADVELLQSPDFQKKIENWIVQSIEKCNDHVINEMEK